MSELSDEEKEAIEWLKRLVKLNKRDNLDDTFAEILLNLIEKQSKEIEELKEGFKIQEHNYQIAMKEIEQRWEDKIKAKIEELEAMCISEDIHYNDVLKLFKELLEEQGE